MAVDLSGGGCAAGCEGGVAEHFRLAGYPVRRCRVCGLWALGARHGGEPATDLLDRDEFEGAFYELRRSNYETTLNELVTLRSRAPGKLLDVGCSSGWFLRQALASGFECFGIEPDEFFYHRARALLPAKVEVVHGYFDRDLPATWAGFEVISFNDVFEHLEDPLGVLRACRQRILPDGLVVLSLASADGFVYRLASALGQLGFSDPLERAFQIHYPYPHLFYFDERSVSVMAKRAGFELVAQRQLRSFSLRGALHRAQMDSAQRVLGQLRNYGAALALVAFAGLQHFFPSDNMLFVLRPTPA